MSRSFAKSSGRWEFEMKAAVLHAIRTPFRIEEVPVPTLGPDDVLVETHTCGICRTDLHIQDGLAYVPRLPHVPGHEPAGVVAAVGERVEGIRVGQRVVPHLFLTCGRCSYCRTGQDAQCSDLGGVLGVTAPGGFAAFFRSPARNLLPLPDKVSFEAGGLVSCAVITALHAFRRARVTANEVAVVLGAGGIGQILVQLLRSAGARVVVVSRSVASLDAVRQDGAALALALNAPDVIEQVRSFGDGEGAHCVFECVGVAATMKTAARMARCGGRIVVIGEEPEFPAIDTIQIAQRELEIIGSRNGSVQDAADCLALLASGVIRPPIARRLPLEELNDALALMRRGAVSGRIVIQLK
ncbi:MAG: zinc-binding dehydrogenase [Verrucomicrobia bacterium]|nr:zinc-binding dehydrogenase [Verrucomicrobiota bacterium]